jgi:S1-C subfamily serine protease
MGSGGRILVFLAVAAGLAWAGSVWAKNGTAAREAVATKTCLVMAENELGLPVAYASGFLLGNGSLVVTDLATVTLPGAKQVTLRFRDNRRVAVKRFLAADPVAGLAVLKLEGDPPSTGGLTMSMASSVAGTEVTAIGWKWAQDVDAAPGKVSNGVSASSVAALLKVEPPSPDVTFLRFDADQPEIASGAPVVDAAGGVVGVLLQMAGTDRAVIVPATLLRNALMFDDTELQPLSALPKALWPILVTRMAGKPATPEDFT